MGDASEVRRRSWETRRAKYGERGHAGSYARSQNYHGRRALAWIIQMHREETLSEGQCCAALDMDRVDFRRLAPTVAPPLGSSFKPIFATGANVGSGSGLPWHPDRLPEDWSKPLNAKDPQPKPGALICTDRSGW